MNHAGGPWYHHCPEAETTYRKWLAAIRLCRSKHMRHYEEIRREKSVTYWNQAYRWHWLHCADCQQLHQSFLETIGVAYEKPVV